jgi:manganese oxidase
LPEELPMHRAAVIAAVSLLAALGPAVLPVAQPNDNRTPAGRIRNGVLTLDIEAKRATWQPEGPGGGGLEVAAFGETGKPAQVPGPLVRVRAGTRIDATIRNTFAKPLTVFGLGARGLKDSLVIPARGTRSVSFTLGTPGTFFYLGRTGTEPPFDTRSAAEQSLNGAIVVDSIGETHTPLDRILVMSWYSAFDSTSATGLGPNPMTINGLSWPHTERLDYTQGDSVHWKVINVTDIDHPMHLHGFYFRLQSRGNGSADSVFPRDMQRMAVTEVLQPFTTLSMAWKAERPGNWIFHCHYALHLSDLASLDNKQGAMNHDLASHHASDAPHQMFGLVMGLRVAPKGPAVALAEAPRPIRVIMRERANVYGSQPGFSFVLGGSPDEVDPNAMPVPGRPLILERGKPVAITVVNTSTEHASVHWHGIELESYPDGVPGWSGSGTSVLPSIRPGDSITVRYTPPRAGTFMYHSHFNEATQMGGGAYGAIIVVEPGATFDEDTDRILFFGTAGIAKNVIKGPFPGFLLNGQEQPGPMSLTVGKRYRFRLLNLAGDTPTFVSLRDGAKPVEWTSVAKDGYALPSAQVTREPATLVFDPGEIYDFEFTPTAAGDLSLVFGPPPIGPAPALPPGFSPPPPLITVPVRIR